MQSLIMLALILFATTLAGYLFNKMNLPAVIGQLLVGIILGPAILNWIQPSSELIHIFAEVGLVILMFMAGLESDLKLLRKYLKPSVVVAILGVIIPIVVFTIIAQVIRLGLLESIFLGVVFSATSTSISVEVLKSINQMDSREGVTLLGAAIIDDIIGVIMLSVITALASGENTQSGIQSFGLPVIFSVQILYFIGVYLIVKWVAPFLLKLGNKINVQYSLVLTALIILFAMAGAAELIGLSAVAGSFFAGLAIEQTNYSEKVEEPIKSMGYLVFVPVFFTSIGLEMTISGILDNIILFVVLTIFAILTKLYGSAFGARSVGFEKPNAMMVGSGMVSRGEVALIVAQVGYSAQLMSESLYSTVIGVIIVTTLLAPFLMRYYISKIDPES